MKQREMPFFQEVGEPDNLPEYLISRCRNEHDALALCWAKRRVKFSQAKLCAELGISTSHFSNILAGEKYPPYDFRIKLQAFCGNWAIRQFEDQMIGAKTVKESPEQRRIRELEQQLEAARRAA